MAALLTAARMPNRVRGLLWLCAIGIAVFLPHQGNAQPVRQGIAAVVNDQAVTNRDVDARVAFIISTSNMPNTTETADRLREQVLSQLITETLQLQEAERLGLSATSEEMARGVASVEQQNNMPPGGMFQMLDQRGLDREAILRQIRAQMSWAKVVGRSIRPKVNIGDEEVDNYLAQIRANLDKPQHLVAEIFLAVDSPAKDAEMKALAQRLVEQIKGGANFQALAKQFSQSPTAAVGGDMGWVVQGQLDEALDKALVRMQPKTMSPPIRSLTGYHILLLRDRRESVAPKPEDTIVVLSQAFMPTEGEKAVPAETRDEIIGQLAEMKTCGEMNDLVAERELPGSGDTGRVRVGDLPETLAQPALSLPLNQPSGLLQTQGGVTVLMVCEREEDVNLPPRKQVQDKLEMQKIEMMARRALRDLQHSANIEKR